MKNFRILIVEPSEIVAEGLKGIIGGSTRIEDVCCIGDVTRLEEKILSFKPNIVIINPLFVKFSEKGNLKNIVFSSKFFTMAIQTSYIEPQMLRSFAEVIELGDDRQRIIGKLFGIMNREIEKKENDIELSRREKDVLVEIAKGLTNKEISEKLHLSVNTVMTHRKNITRKTNIKSVSGLTVYALLNGFVDIDI